ncbi:MAG: hypothetical protein HUK21_09840 [Fibrobacteraceae bacterium]|nr:hypothetical protein [Fibrobacteraceae bacterium]
MKRVLFLALCPFVLSAFAGPYEIDSFEAQDVGTPDEYITAEFGGELKTAPADEVESLQSGRLIVRQKFEDPFGESETSYQLYQGGAGDLSSMTALSVPEGVSYGDVVKSKIYPSRGTPAEKDFEKVYFDGQSVYVPGASSAVAYVDGSMIELKAGDNAPVAAAVPAPEVEEESSSSSECSEYDDDCDSGSTKAVAAKTADEEECDEDEEDCDDDTDYYNTSKTNRDADERDYAASEASGDVTDRFGIADEVRFWSAVGLSAVAAASAVVGVLQHMEGKKAKDANDKLDKVKKGIVANINDVCAGDQQCVIALKNSKDPSIFGVSDNWTYASLEERMNTNKDTQDSYYMARNIWFGVTAVSLTAAIVLFVW